jgi:CBS domain-containing protein
MTSNPICCTASTTLDQVAQLMARNDCGEIPVVDAAGHPMGVITDRDIVCRVVADGRDPASHTAGEFMSRPVFTVGADAPIDEVLSVMEEHRIRRVPVLDGDGCCTGIIAQADIASAGDRRYIAELVSEVSRHTGRASL